jgi:hypothetical protein
MLHHLTDVVRRRTRRQHTTDSATSDRPNGEPVPSTSPVDVSGNPPPATVEFRLTRIDDPDGCSVILAVSGLLADRALFALAREIATIPANTLLHLDLAHACILTIPMMRRLEAWTDELDDAGLRVRISGLSPNHPALRHQEQR